MKKLAMLILWLIWATEGWAADGAASFLSIPVDAVGASLGGAYIVRVSDAAAVYWNPARLGSIGRFGFTSSLANRNFGEGDDGVVSDRHFFIAGVFPIARRGTLGMAWKRYSMPDIELRKTADSPSEYFSNNEDAFFASYGAELVQDRISIGLQVKYIMQNFTNMSGVSSSGAGFSIGLWYQLINCLQLALRADDNFAVTWSSGHKDNSSLRGIAGAALSLFQGHLAAEINMVQIKDYPLQLCGGLEFAVTPPGFLNSSSTGILRLAARIGLNHLNLEDRGYDFGFSGQDLCAGFGLGLLVEKHLLNFDYCYIDNAIIGQNRFSMSLFL